MIINHKTPAIAALFESWNKPSRVRTAGGKQKRQRRFREQLAREVIEPHVGHAIGELVLLYHEYVTMVPSGVHSFAYGSEMESKTIYWVTAGRVRNIQPFSLMTEPELAVRFLMSEEGILKGRRTCTIGNRYLIPLQWKKYLEPRYGKHPSKPHFMLSKKEDSPVTDLEHKVGQTLDISVLGQHLFTNTHYQLDWATKIELVIGTMAVKKWLTDNGSQATLEQIIKL